MSSATHKNAQTHAVRNHGDLGAVFAATALAFLPSLAAADTDTDSFTVSATVLAACEVTANDLAFGNYNPVVASHLDAASTLSVRCTSGTGYNVGLSLGDGAGATVAQRRMTQGSDTLSYVLYRDSNRTQLWGTTIGADTLSGTGNGAASTIDVYGRVPMQQTAPAGDYEDTIVVTVTW